VSYCCGWICLLWTLAVLQQASFAASEDSLKVGVIQSPPYVNISHEHDDKIRGLFWMRALLPTYSTHSPGASFSFEYRLRDRSVETCGRPQVSFCYCRRYQRRDARPSQQGFGRTDRGTRSSGSLSSRNRTVKHSSQSTHCLLNTVGSLSTDRIPIITVSLEPSSRILAAKAWFDDEYRVDIYTDPNALQQALIIFKTLIDYRFLNLMAVLLTTMIITSHIFWFLERKSNDTIEKE